MVADSLKSLLNLLSLQKEPTEIKTKGILDCGWEIVRAKREGWGSGMEKGVGWGGYLVGKVVGGLKVSWSIMFGWLLIRLF